MNKQQAAALLQQLIDRSIKAGIFDRSADVHNVQGALWVLYPEGTPGKKAPALETAAVAADN
jgi:hypothetical protein